MNRLSCATKVLLCATLFFCALGQRADAQLKSDKTFKVNVNLVLVNATVTGPDGRTVTNLGIDDFSITEDLKEQKIKVFQPTNSAFHVVLLIDTSASTAAKLDLIRNAAVRFFDQLSPADQIAILEVGDSPKLLEDFTADRKRLTAAMDRLGVALSESTKLYDSIVYTLENLMGEVKDRKALVILSDACDNGSSANEHRMKLSVYKDDAVIYSLLVDTEQDQLEVLKENMRWLACVSLILCADYPSTEDKVRNAARLLVQMLPQPSCVSLFENVYRRSLVNVLPCEVSREKIEQGIAESKPYCDSLLRSSQGGQVPDDNHLIVAIIDSISTARDRIPVRVQAKATPLMVGDLSDTEIRHQISKIIGNVPSDPDRVTATLPASYRASRSILFAASKTTGGTAFDLARLEQVNEYYSEVARELRTIYTLGYYSADSTPLLRSLEVKVRRPGYTVKARRAYMPKDRQHGVGLGPSN